MTKVTRRQTKRCRQLLDDFKEKRRCSKLKYKEELDRSVWRTLFGRVYWHIVLVERTSEWLWSFWCKQNINRQQTIYIDIIYWISQELDSRLVLCNLFCLYRNASKSLFPDRFKWVSHAEREQVLKQCTEHVAQFGFDTVQNILVLSLFVFFISLLIDAQHVSGNHVPIIRSWRLRDAIALCWYVPWLQGGCQDRLVVDVTFCILYFSSNSCSTCFGQPCAHHQELTTAWCYSLVLICAVAAGKVVKSGW